MALRIDLLEALQGVADGCESLRGIDGDVRRGNLASAVEWHAENCLGQFWQHWDAAQGILERIPADALQDLQALAGRPWKLATRQALDEIARPIQKTRPWYEATLQDDQDRQAAERQAMLTAWETADFSTWPALLADLAKLTANLRAIRNERYQAPGANPPDAAYLGIVLGDHSASRTVDGDSLEPVEFGRKAWQLLTMLVKAGADGVCRTQVEEITDWPDKLKGSLNKAIEALQLEVGANQKGVWTLAEIRHP